MCPTTPESDENHDLMPSFAGLTRLRGRSRFGAAKALESIAALNSPSAMEYKDGGLRQNPEAEWIRGSSPRMTIILGIPLSKEGIYP
jgi:hypothetical protein